MAVKPPNRKQLSQTMIETYIQLCGMCEMIRQMAMAEMSKNYKHDFTANQRRIFELLELDKVPRDRSYLQHEEF